MSRILVLNRMPSTAVIGALVARGMLDDTRIVVSDTATCRTVDEMANELVLSAKQFEQVPFVDLSDKKKNEPFYRTLPKFQKRGKSRKH